MSVLQDAVIATRKKNIYSACLKIRTGTHYGNRRDPLGATYEIELLEKSAEAFLFGERGKFSPKGVVGGKEASKNIFTFEDDDGPTNPKMVSKIVGVKLKRGQSVRIDTPGGGGYGNPLDRSKQARDYDVQLGYVTEEKP